MAKQKKKKLKKSILFRGISFLLIVVSFIALFFIYRLGILPFKYFMIIVFIVLVIDFFIHRLVVSKNWKKRMWGSCLAFLFMILFSVGIFYESVTLQFFKNAFQSRERIENYQVLVLNSSNYGSLKELKSGKIGVPFAKYSEGASKMQEEIKKKTSLTLQESDNSTLVESLMHKNLRVIVMEEAQKNLFMEIDEEFASEVKVLETISVTIQNKIKKKDSEITKKPFHVFISGSDDYGTIADTSRSDMNMIATINPITHQVLITSIPRDYYINLHGIDKKDKLTHSSLYGIDTSLKSLEDLFDIEIDYYVKVNFSSLVSLVDAVNGIDVNSEEEFTAHYYDEPLNEWITYQFNKGMNHLNGKQALAFSRERKSFLLGDRVRATHQQLVLKSLIDKVISPSILTNYTNLLNALNGSFDTNMHYEDILGFLQKQLDSNPSWNISTFTLEGVDGSEKVYSMPSVSTYVMKPDEESVKEASELMRQIFVGDSQ